MKQWIPAFTLFSIASLASLPALASHAILPSRDIQWNIREMRADKRLLLEKSEALVALTLQRHTVSLESKGALLNGIREVVNRSAARVSLLQAHQGGMHEAQRQALAAFRQDLGAVAPHVQDMILRFNDDPRTVRTVEFAAEARALAGRSAAARHSADRLLQATLAPPSSSSTAD